MTYTDEDIEAMQERYDKWLADRISSFLYRLDDLRVRYQEQYEDENAELDIPEEVLDTIREAFCEEFYVNVDE